MAEKSARTSGNRYSFRFFNRKNALIIPLDKSDQFIT